MRWDFGFEFSVERAEIFLLPQVADGLLAVELQLGKIGGDFRGLLARVEEADGSIAVPPALRTWMGKDRITAVR